MSDLNRLIKELRTKTGAGFLDCKKSLEENNNDIEKSIESLRKKGLAKASKKTDREANEGAVGIYSNDEMIILIKVNSETDFAAKSKTFLDFIDNLGKIILELNDKNLDKDKFLNSNYNGGSIRDYFNSMISTIGENLILNNLIIKDIKNNLFSYYIHNGYKDNIGKIISMIMYSVSENDDEIKNLSKNLCMHIAAMKPESLDINDLDENLIEKEKKIQKELILSSGKPENIADKILDGKMKKFYSEVTLLNQTYILDQDKTVKTCIKDYESKFNFKIQSFEIISL
tara:strand:- start:3668 stop:4525 length:858 start_codon:yes stop_codon:yes gene_type:complete